MKEGVLQALESSAHSWSKSPFAAEELTPEARLRRVHSRISELLMFFIVQCQGDEQYMFVSCSLWLHDGQLICFCSLAIRRRYPRERFKHG
jgi:hypothetical protein